MADIYETDGYSGNLFEYMSEEDKLYLREIIETMINEALLKNGLVGEF